jgi:hypothetical protein
VCVDLKVRARSLGNTTSVIDVRVSSVLRMKERRDWKKSRTLVHLWVTSFVVGSKSMSRSIEPRDHNSPCHRQI